MRMLVVCAAVLTAPLAMLSAPALSVAAEATATAAPAEAALRKTIADFQAGKPDYASMSPELAEAVRPQEATMAQLAPLGAITAVTRTGDGDTPYTFAVTFEAGVTLNWAISLDGQGLITGLLVTQ
ncbi:MAG: hypothetical protein GC145_12075 [Caulobacter sp.]|nr:hypothetical protein [Caulobacter sp.]